MAGNEKVSCNLSYEVILDLSRELIKGLLINGLDEIGDKNEGNVIFKSINSTMLRILENCETTLVIIALLELIKEFQEKDDINSINLGVKCLLKVSNKLSENNNNIQIEKIFLQIHFLLLGLEKNEKNNPIKKITKQRNIIIDSVRTVVRIIVKLKKEKKLKDYSKFEKNQEINDKFLLKWIKEELEKI